MTLYEIVKSLQAAKGSLAKQTILTANAGNGLLKAYMKAVLDPSINYYQTKIPVVACGEREFSSDDVEHMIESLAKRVVTGQLAKISLELLSSTLNSEGQELLGYLVKRSIGGSVGETMVLKTWPKLFFVPPYMRCAGMSPKVKAEYAALPYFYVQTKYDGSFAYLEASKDGAKLFTRAGSFYPTGLAKRLEESVPEGYVVMGEMLVYEDGVLLSRKVGNGILNSALQGGEIESKYDVRMVAWDMVKVAEFEARKSLLDYDSRFHHMFLCVNDNGPVTVAETHTVSSLERAFELNREALLRGDEGTVWKKPDGIWRESSSGTRDAVKVKIKFEAEYVVTGKYEGEGKAKGMLGGFNIATSCAKIVNNVGSGFSDAQRQEFWEADTDGWIVTLEANDVIDKTGSATESLFLPIFIERRLDKTEADSRERVLEQLQAAKEGS